MYQRGELIIFRPIQIESDGLFHREKPGRLTVGIIQDVQLHNNILIGMDCIEKNEAILIIRVVGLYRPTVEYPDKLNIASNSSVLRINNQNVDCCPEYSHWYTLRRDVLANEIEEMKPHDNCGVDFAKVCSSEVTDLDILFAKYEVDESSIDGMSIQNVQADVHVYRPSIFHGIILKAKGALRQHAVLSSLFESFKSWQVFISNVTEVKVNAAVIIQKYARKYFERETLGRQILYKKWYTVQKEYLHEYVIVNPCDSSVDCYNVRGTSVYFHTKALAEKWSEQMRTSLDTISFYAKRNILSRQKEAMRRWNLSLFLQAKEIEDMMYEDIISSSINCNCNL